MLQIRSESPRATTLVTRFEELDRMRAGWERLEHVCPLPTQQFIWTRAGAAAFPEFELAVVADGDPEAPAAIAPLTRWRGRLELSGARQLGEPGDLIAVDAEASRRLAAAVRKLGMPLVLHRVPAAGSSVTAIERAFGRGVRTVGAPAYPRVQLDERWLEPDGGLSSRRRGDLRRARRRAEALGEVTFEDHEPSPDQVGALLARAFAVEACSWKGRAGTALSRDGRRQAFFREYARLAAERRILRISFMWIGRRPVAMQMAVETGFRLWLLRIGFDDGFARCSPGMLLLSHALQRSAARGLESVELLGRAEPWTRAWTVDVRETVDVHAFPANLRGAAAVTAAAARSRSRRVGLGV